MSVDDINLMIFQIYSFICLVAYMDFQLIFVDLPEGLPKITNHLPATGRHGPSFFASSCSAANEEVVFPVTNGRS